MPHYLVFGNYKVHACVGLVGLASSIGSSQSTLASVLQLDIFEVYKVRNSKNTLKREENYSVESRLVLAM